MNRLVGRSLFLLFIFSLCACRRSLTPAYVERSGCVVRSVPDEFSFDPFYEKYCDAEGIPIISSAEVDDLALQEAYYIVMNMLLLIPDMHEELVAKGV